MSAHFNFPSSSGFVVQATSYQLQRMRSALVRIASRSGAALAMLLIPGISAANLHCSQLPLGQMYHARHTATVLPSGKVLLAGGTDLNAEVYDPEDGRRTPTSAMVSVRFSPTATLLPNGKVLVAGGLDNNGSFATTELYDPVAGTWTAGASMAHGRSGHTATLLANGKVLVAGGHVMYAGMKTAELYDPISNSWSPAASLSVTRLAHTATLLPSGKVLVIGGVDGENYRGRAELYDPVSNTWSLGGQMATPRQFHTATMLASGKVVVTGGQDASQTVIGSTELFDPASNAFSATGALQSPRQSHSSMLLPSGELLVFGGNSATMYWSQPNGLTSIERFDESSGVWSGYGALTRPRMENTITLLPSGRVLLMGGTSGIGSLPEGDVCDVGDPSISRPGLISFGRLQPASVVLPNGEIVLSGGGATLPNHMLERFDPLSTVTQVSVTATIARNNATLTRLPSGLILVTGGTGNSGATDTAVLYNPGDDSWANVASMTTRRAFHSATLLPSGKVLVAGGQDFLDLADAELFDPAAGTWSPAGPLTTGRRQHTATLLASGKVLVTGGLFSEGTAPGDFPPGAELYDPATNQWAPAGTLSQTRYRHSATRLPTGEVLVTGGETYNYQPIALTELYDPLTNAWRTVAPMLEARSAASSVLMSSGRVLVAGGMGTATYLASAESYDPATNAWKPLASMTWPRNAHVAHVIPDGRVVVLGGRNVNGGLMTPDYYDPQTNRWHYSGTLRTPRHDHTATLVLDGSVILAGGRRDGVDLREVERYEPAKKLWTTGASSATARSRHTATLLASGRILVAGGTDAAQNSAELYDVASDSWSFAGQPAAARRGHTATLLASGKVLVAGGSGAQPLNSAEIYDPVSGNWSPAAPMTDARSQHTATLLTNGRVLVVGGLGGDFLASAEIYDPVSNTWSSAASPTYARRSHTATLQASGKVVIAGGDNASGSQTRVELYDPALNFWTADVSATIDPRSAHTAVPVPTKGIFLFGGLHSQSYPNGSDRGQLYLTSNFYVSNVEVSVFGERVGHSATALPSGEILIAGGRFDTNAIDDVYLWRPNQTGLDALRPIISQVLPGAVQGAPLQLKGERLTGDLEYSSGRSDASAANSPLVLLRRLDNNQQTWLMPAARNRRSAQFYSSSALSGVQPGPHAVTVFAGGVASASALTVVAAAGQAGVVNVDGSVAGETRFHAHTDGVMILRYLNGITGTALTRSATASSAQRTDPDAVLAYLDGIRPLLDIDGDGVVEARTDGVLLLRYLLGVRGATLTTGAIAAPPRTPTRTQPAQVEAYLSGLTR